MRHALAGERWLAAALLLLAAAVYTWGTWRYFTVPVPGGNDFMAHYTAWEAYLEHGLNPYSDEAALYTQMAIRGRPALPGEDENRLTYPFYSILIHAPFIWIDYALARAIYMTLLQAALFAGVGVTLCAVRWQPPLWLAGVVLGWSLLNYHAARGVILGQFAIFGFFSLAGAQHLLRVGRPAAAGALLVLSTVKPTLVFLALPFVLLWAVARLPAAQWRPLVGAFGFILAVLCVGSWVALPTWLGDWLYRIAAYSGYTVGQSPVWLLAHAAVPALGGPGEAIVTAALLLMMLWAWRQALRTGEAGEFHWALGVTLTVSNLIVPRSATTNYVMLLPPTLWVLAALDRAGRIGRATALLVMLVMLVGHWWLHAATVVGNQEQPIMFIPWPVALLAVLLAGRRWLLRDAALARLTAAGQPARSRLVEQTAAA